MSENNIENLEHKDGLGDLLKERESIEFSWSKTIIVMLGLLGVILIFIYFVFNVSKRHLTNNSDVQTKLNQDNVEHVTLISPTEPKEIFDDTSKKNQESEKAEVKPVSKTNKLTKEVKKTTFKIITGTYKNFSNAKEQVKKLKSNNIDSFIKKTFRSTKDNKTTTLYQVQAGSYNTQKSAKLFQSKLKKMNIESYIIEQ